MIRIPLAIDPAHPAFEGHFPSQPIVPGVVLLDCGLRAIAGQRDIAASDRCRIAAAKFLSPVGPGEPVRLEFERSSTLTEGYRLQIYAGTREHERLALSSNITFEPAAAEPS